MPSSRNKDQKVVIIGAGIVGVNLADELVSRGWSDITVVEQGPLSMPGGSTSHAPGLVFQTNASRTMSHLAQYTVKKLLSIPNPEPAAGLSKSCFNQVGGLEIATTAERVEELKRKHGWAESWGIQGTRLLSPAECLEIYPLLNKEKTLGGLHIPSDGLALAKQATQALIARTQQRGVRYLDKTLVTGIEQADGHVKGVKTSKGFVSADLAISCAGFWGVELGAMVDIRIPLLPLAHQYVKTNRVSALAGRNSHPNGAGLPILRHQDHDLYYREHGDQIGIGYYGHKPMPVVAASLGVTPEHVDEHHMPSRLKFTEEDFAPAWQESQAFLPSLRKTSIEQDAAFNGIFSFTPDGGPLIGESPHLSGFFVAEAVWVTHSAGIARAVAEILTTGSSTIDVTECDINRFEQIQLTPEYVKETGEASFEGVYDISHPAAPSDSPRELRISPFYGRQRELGAVFKEDGAAWECAQWYEGNETLLRSMPRELQTIERDAWSGLHYSAIAAAEAWKARTAVAMFDLTPERRVEISGPGAAELLQRLSTGDVSKPPGAVIEALILTEAGGIRSVVTIARLAKNVFQVGVSSANDIAYLTSEAGKQADQSASKYVHVRDLTGATCSIGLMGPKATEILRKHGFDMSYSSKSQYIRKLSIDGVPAQVISPGVAVGAVWQIQSSADCGQRLWDAIWKAGQAVGVVAGGQVALTALRMEAGQRSYGVDIGTEDTPHEAGLGHLIAAGRANFVGSTALAQRSKPARMLRCITIDNGVSMLMGSEPVYYQNRPVGYVTSAAFGYTVRTPIAFAWLSTEMGVGARVEVDYFGKRTAATVATEPVLDSVNRKDTGKTMSKAATQTRIQARL